MAPFDGICSTDIWVVRPLNGIDVRFLFYKMASQEFVHVATQGSEGTRMPRAKWEFVSRMSCLIPPLPEQRAIAHVLGVLDDKIELNRRMNRTLEEMARALFKSWFVDYEPVRAKMDGRWRPGESLPGLPAHLYDLFPDRLVDSKLGEIPEGWEVKVLGDTIMVTKGRSYNSKELAKSDVALVTLKSFSRGGGYRPDGLKSFTGTYKAEQIVCPGEIVVACTDVTQAAAVIGRPAIVSPSLTYRILVASLDVLIVRPIPKSMTTSFLYFLMDTNEFAHHTYAHTTGTTVLHLSKEAIPSFTFTEPPAHLLPYFDLTAKTILFRIQMIQQEMYSLAIQRDTLLPKLMSGELQISQLPYARSIQK